MAEEATNPPSSFPRWDINLECWRANGIYYVHTVAIPREGLKVNKPRGENKLHSLRGFSQYFEDHKCANRQS